MISERVYFKGFNEIRAVAALMVVFHHIELYKFRSHVPSLFDNHWLDSFIAFAGKNGVYLFFCLSGFLITYLLLAEKQGKGTISLKKFYIRRILRIWPLYYLILAVSFVLFPLLYQYTSLFEGEGYTTRLIGHLMDHYILYLLMYVFFIPNIALAFGYHVPGASQTWSVGVEEQFYILWPIVIRFLHRYLLAALVTIAVLKIAANYLLVPTLAGMNLKTFMGMNLVQLNNFLAGFRIEFMTLGSIFAWLAFNKMRLLIRLLKSFSVRLLAFAIAGGLLFVQLDPLLIAVCFSLVITIVALYPPKAPTLKSLDYLGRISYGIYMYHPMVMILSYALINKLGVTSLVLYNVLIYVCVVFFTLLFSHFSYQWIEKRFLKIKTRYTVISSGDEAKVHPA